MKTTTAIHLAKQEIESSIFFQKYWLQYDDKNQLSALQEKYFIVTSQDRKKLLSEIHAADLPSEIKEKMRSENNLFLLKMGAIDLRDPKTFQLSDLSQERFEELTSLRLIDFYYKYSQSHIFSVKEIFQEFVDLSLPPKEMEQLTKSDIWIWYDQKIFTLREMATLYKENVEKFSALSSAEVTEWYLECLNEKKEVSLQKLVDLYDQDPKKLKLYLQNDGEDPSENRQKPL